VYSSLKPDTGKVDYD